MSISEPDQARICDILTAAFQEDPFWAVIFPKKEARKHHLQKLFRVFVKNDVGFAEIYTEGNPIQAVGIFYPSDIVDMSIWGLIRAGMLRVIFSSAFGGLIRALKISGKLGKIHHKYASEPHNYLSFLAVDPASQGKKLASKVMRKIFQQVDARHLSLYLETMNATDVAIYEHFGFKVMEQCRFEEYDMTVWAMRRN